MWGIFRTLLGGSQEPTLDELMAIKVETVVPDTRFLSIPSDVDRDGVWKFLLAYSRQNGDAGRLSKESNHGRPLAAQFRYTDIGGLEIALPYEERVDDKHNPATGKQIHCDDLEINDTLRSIVKRATRRKYLDRLGDIARKVEGETMLKVGKVHFQDLKSHKYRHMKISVYGQEGGGCTSFGTIDHNFKRGPVTYACIEYCVATEYNTAENPKFAVNSVTIKIGIGFNPEIHQSDLNSIGYSLKIAHAITGRYEPTSIIIPNVLEEVPKGEEKKAMEEASKKDHIKDPKADYAKTYVKVTQLVEAISREDAAQIVALAADSKLIELKK